MHYKTVDYSKKVGINILPNCDSRVLDEKYTTQFEIFLTYPKITKIDIIELYEINGLCYYCDDCFSNKFETNEMFWDIPIPDNINISNPSYASEYISTIGMLFIGGYIDFLCRWEDNHKIDFPTNLSYYKDDKYQAWIYFRDNFFYKERFLRKFDDNYNIIDFALWDNPESWSEYNILVARTKKGDKYFNEILAPRFYEKYKDLSVEIDENGNIVRWIGQINR